MKNPLRETQTLRARRLL